MPSLPDPSAIGLAAPQPVGSNASIDGTALGRAAAQFGQDVAQSAQALQEHYDTINAQNALNQLNEKKLQLTMAPPSSPGAGDGGFMSIKGGDAMGANGKPPILNTYTGQMSDAVDSIAQSNNLSGGALRIYKQRAAAVNQQFQADLLAHVMRESQVYQTDVVTQHIGTLTQQTAQYSDSIPKVLDNLRAIADVYAPLHVANGGSAAPEDLRQAALPMQSKALMIAMEDRLARNDVAGANTLLNALGKDYLTADDAVRAQQLVQHGVSQQQAFSAVDAAVSTLRPPSTPSQVLQNVVMQMESGGKDHNTDGTPVVSPRGAMYAMQVMPDTAANPGFGIPPAADNTPAEYNRVGAHYLQAMVQKYNGDTASALAAYNAGPAAVDAAKAAAAKDGSDWKTHLPAETQAYVAKGVTAFNARMSSPPPLLSAQQLEEAALQHVQETTGAPPTPQARELIQQQSAHTAALMKNNQEVTRENVVQPAQQWLAQNGGDFTHLPTPLYNAVLQNAPDQLDNLKSYAQHFLPGADTKTNPAAYSAAIANPGELVKMPESVYQNFLVSNFSPADREKIDALRHSTQQGALAFDTQTFNSEVDNRLTSIGIQTNRAKLSSDLKTASQVDMIRHYLANGITQQQGELGRKMTPAEMRTYIDAQFAKPAQIPGFLWGSSTVPVLSVKSSSDIPGGELDQVKAALAKHGIAEPSEEQIMQTYWRGKGVK